MNNLFEQWHKRQTANLTSYEKEQAAFAAGIQAERERLRGLVEKRIKMLKEFGGTHTEVRELKVVLNWLTDPKPITDKTDTRH